MPELMRIADIKIGVRHRKDMGDLQVLADSIAAEGLLQPIGVMEDGHLVFGERRLLACRDVLGWEEMPARTVKVSSIIAGEFHENEVRKDFTPSERVAIERAIQRLSVGRPSKENRQNLVDKDQSARLSGFGNRETARQARTVVEKGTPQLVEAMDRGEVSISAAAEMANEPAEEQRRRLELPSKKEAVEESKRTGAAILARDGKYHAHVQPEDQARSDLWLKCKDAIWALSDISAEPADVVSSVPSYQREEFDKRLREAAGITEAVLKIWESTDEHRAAE